MGSDFFGFSFCNSIPKPPLTKIPDVVYTISRSEIALCLPRRRRGRGKDTASSKQRDLLFACENQTGFYGIHIILRMPLERQR